MALGLLSVFACWFAGETLAHALSLPVPGSVLGMVLLFLALELRIARRAHVDPVARGLTAHLTLFFLPVGVGVFVHLELIRRAGLAIAVSSVLSTLAVLATVGLVQQRLEPRG